MDSRETESIPPYSPDQLRHFTDVCHHVDDANQHSVSSFGTDYQKQLNVSSNSKLTLHSRANPSNGCVSPKNNDIDHEVRNEHFIIRHDSEDKNVLAVVREHHDSHDNLDDRNVLCVRPSHDDLDDRNVPCRCSSTLNESSVPITSSCVDHSSLNKSECDKVEYVNESTTNNID